MKQATAKAQGLQVIFNKSHELGERLYYDLENKNFYDSHTDIGYQLNDLPFYLSEADKEILRRY